jgi:hypothetical protein
VSETIGEAVTSGSSPSGRGPGTGADFSPEGLRRAHAIVESGRAVGKVVVSR